MRTLSTAALLICLVSPALAGQDDAPSPLLTFLADRVMAEVDLDGDRRVARAEFKTVRQRRFAEADSNHDRLVTPAELRTELLSVAGGLGVPWSAQLFTYMDLDDSGTVTAAEADTVGEAVFTQLDRNGDGFVTPAEVYPALARSD